MSDELTVEEFTFDYFRNEFKRFWNMCGDATMTTERLQRAFNGLAFVASNTYEQSERVTHLFTVAGMNYEHRLPYFLVKEHSRAFKQSQAKEQGK